MSILRYPGGKTRAVKILKDYIPENCEAILSPFFGGGSFELYCLNNNINVIANDKFEPLINFWTVLQNQPTELIHEIEKRSSVTKEDFLIYKQKLLDIKLSSVLRACYYFIVNRCSFNGSTCSGGFSREASVKRFNESSVSRLKKINLDNISFYCMDFEDFLNTHEDDVFIYADPPYYMKDKLYDLKEKFTHERLFQVLKKRKNWMLCYNDCTYIRELYSDYKIVEIGWKYGMNKSKQSSEILIIS